MNKYTIAACLAMLAVAGCTVPDPFKMQTLDKGEPVGVVQMLAEHPGKIACIDYRASDNSCASLSKAQRVGNRIVAVETGAVRGLSGQIERVSLRSRGRIVDGATCVAPDEIESVTAEGGMGEFLQETTRLLISQFGGEVCARYFRVTDGFVVSSTGGNGKPFPPGDSRLRFVDAPLPVRAQ
ncbi:hypothetical protein ABMC89_06080 [Sulfitobacter sp. HNIBRBA3233]|uniref:hypothetical protein n=1 Tax=Sulfitobacter marinivivus TaxID=3158558 RepID=UPI0032E01C5D